MDEMTQQNAALVEQAAAASQAIVEQAQQLNAMIARYKVADDAHRTVKAAPRAAAVTARSPQRASKKPVAAEAQAPAPARKVANGASEWNEF